MVAVDRRHPNTQVIKREIAITVTVIIILRVRIIVVNNKQIGLVIRPFKQFYRKCMYTIF